MTIRTFHVHTVWIYCWKTLVPQLSLKLAMPRDFKFQRTNFLDVTCSFRFINHFCTTSFTKRKHVIDLPRHSHPTNYETDERSDSYVKMTRGKGGGNRKGSIKLRKMCGIIRTRIYDKGRREKQADEQWGFEIWNMNFFFFFQDGRGCNEGPGHINAYSHKVGGPAKVTAQSSQARV